MREIKFRGKTATTNTWIYGNYAIVDGYHVIYKNGKPRIIQLSTLGRYTGLKDKDGTEIYEEDIVEVTHEYEFKTIGQVVWGLDSHIYGNYPAFTIPEFDSDLNSFAEIFDSGKYDIEIIGNIHEHKHLLEAE